jgi:hypothetical protein
MSGSFGLAKDAVLRVLLLLSTLPATAAAWGPSGHRIVAELAEGQISASTRAEVHHLLEVTGAASLADVSNWADDIRDDPSQREHGRATARLHFVNFPDSRCHFYAPKACPGGQCAVAAINRYAAILGDRSKSDIERAEALRFLVHIVADIQQPLHAGYRPDRGGNNYQVRIDGKGSNLHKVWDSKILGIRRLGWKAYARRLARQSISDDDDNPIDWAEQSCRITRDDGIYPPGHSIDKAYRERMLPIAERRIRLAVKRLARLLDQQLGDSR